MIYQISSKDVYKSTQEGATIISWSNDGSVALVESSTPLLTVQTIGTYSDDISKLLSSPEWKQPCKNC